jgi:hypothetical protein
VHTEHANPFRALLDKRVILLALLYVGFPLAAYGLSYWLPTVVKGCLPPTFLKGATAAAGIAAINSVGNLGGFVAQNVVPMIKDWSGSDLEPMLFLAVCLTIAALMVFVVQRLLAQSRTAPMPARLPAE